MCILVSAHKQVIVGFRTFNNKRIGTVHSRVGDIGITDRTFAHQVHSDNIATALAVHKIHARASRYLVVSARRL